MLLARCVQCSALTFSGLLVALRMAYGGLAQLWQELRHDTAMLAGQDQGLAGLEHCSPRGACVPSLPQPLGQATSPNSNPRLDSNENSG